MAVTIFNAGGGGKSKVNVVQAASYANLPSSANGTVGVVTTESIHSIIVSPTQPPVVAGRLWLRSGYSPSKLIALTDTITLSIVAASYCASTTYARVDCYLRIAGAWAKTDYVIYNSDYSDGDLALGVIVNGTMSLITDGTTKKLYCSSGTNANRAMYCTTPLDVTDASAVIFTVSKSAYSSTYQSVNRLAILTEPFTVSATSSSVLSLNPSISALSNVTYTLDVSALVGSFYVGYQGYFPDTAGYLKVHDWRVVY